MAPMSAIDRGAKLLSGLTGLYSKAPPPPAISERTAFACSALFTILYVAPFYLSSTLRATPLSGRDAPSVIQARTRAVGLTCVACTLITVAVLLRYGHVDLSELFRITGFWPLRSLDLANTLGLVIILFAGPLYESLIIDEGWHQLTPSGIKDTLWDSWTGYRNIVIAPASEELVFRSLQISLYLLAEVDATRIVFVSPLIFGLAHIHHLAEFINAHTVPGKRFAGGIWLRGVVRSLFQFTYTTLFGFFAAFIFLRTGSLWTAILAHAFCNCMGLPRFWGRVGNDNVVQDITPDVAQGKKVDDAEDEVLKVGNAVLLPQPQAPPSARSGRLLPSIIYYCLLVAGASGFYRLLWPLTESSNAMVLFS